MGLGGWMVAHPFGGEAVGGGRRCMADFRALPGGLGLASDQEVEEEGRQQGGHDWQWRRDDEAVGQGADLVGKASGRGACAHCLLFGGDWRAVGLGAGHEHTIRTDGGCEKAELAGPKLVLRNNLLVVEVRATAAAFGVDAGNVAWGSTLAEHVASAFCSWADNSIGRAEHAKARSATTQARHPQAPQSGDGGDLARSPWQGAYMGTHHTAAW